MALVFVALAVWARAAAADPAGQVREFSAGLHTGSFPFVLAPGTDGNLWFTDEGAGAGAVGRVTPAGAIIELRSGLLAGSDPYEIAPGPDGNVWFTDEGATSAIGRVTPSGSIVEYPTGVPSSLPIGIAPGSDGNMWFADGGAGAIGRITPSGAIMEFKPGLLAGSYPWKMAAGPDGNVWFTDEGTTSAIGMVTPSGSIREFTNGLPVGSKPYGIAAGPDGNLWFTDIGTGDIGRITPTGAIMEFPGPTHPVAIATGADGNLWFVDVGGTAAIGRITPSGQVTEPAATLPAGSGPFGIAPGPDGNMWFTDAGTVKAIGRLGTGGAPAALAAPSLAGPAQAGTAEACQGHWSSWAGVGPSTSLWPFDGYRWLRDGSPIPGHAGQTYTPAAADVGHRLSCAITVTYPVPFLVSTSAASGALTVRQMTAVVSNLRVSPRRFALSGHKRAGRCVASAKGAHGKRCRRPIRLRIRYTLNVSATVSFTLKREILGRRIRGRCVKPTHKNRKQPKCTRLVPLPGKISIAGKAGANQFVFKGKLGGHKLGPGTYELIVTTAGGKPRTSTFTILP